MYKCVASVLLFAFFAVGDATVTVKSCFEDTDPRSPSPTKYDDYLTDLLNVQIDVELTAQYSYLRLAHLFQQPHLYYPKFAQFFKEKSLEEMEHAEDFMNYQTSRGVQRSERFNFEAVPTVETCKNIDSLYDGFRCARDLEISVTKALTKLVAKVGKISYNQARDAGTSAPAVTYNKALRTAQAALVSDGGDLLISLKEATESTDMISGCNALNINYIELAEHISHEYLGHQVIDTKVLANAVGTLARCSKSYPDARDDFARFDDTCVFAVERLLKLE